MKNIIITFYNCQQNIDCNIEISPLSDYYNIIVGLITTCAVHHSQCWFAVGTSSGCHVCWDLRFQLPITTIDHPIGARIRKLIVHPKEQSWIISSVQGNNEVSMWDVETGARRKALWASPAPPLSQKQV